MNSSFNNPAPMALTWRPSTEHAFEVFTDGCYQPDSERGGWAFVAYRDTAEIGSGCGGAEKTSNNSMELVALLEAANWVNANIHGEATVIWTDSLYGVNGCNSWRHIWRSNGWRKIVQNTNLRRRTIADPENWKALDVALSQSPLVTIGWCKGHSGIRGNERADALARSGLQSLETERR